jgi:proline iminopeptidase
MISLKARGVSLFVRVVGDGYPVVLMHGGPGVDHTMMLPFLPLATRFKLIFYDHRCNGRSKGSSIDTMTWTNLTADAESLRVSLGIRKWAVIGHSFGGMVALEYASRYPESLSHLCILDGCADGHVALPNALRTLKQRGYGRLTLELAERLLRGQVRKSALVRTMAILARAYYSRPSFALMFREAFHGLRIRRNVDAGVYGLKELIPDWSITAKLQDIMTPTLILAGKDDFQFPPEYEALLAQNLGNARLRIVEDAGHNAHMEKPLEVVGIVREFLATVNA